MDTNAIFARLDSFPGDIAFAYMDLSSKQTVLYNADARIPAASMIKLAVMTRVFFAFETGALDPNTFYTVRAEDKLPSCGALTYLHEEIRVTLSDLMTLMIILSDNTATNILIDLLGIAPINQTMAENGFPGITLSRKLFDEARARQGIENRVTARDVMLLLKGIYKGTLISKSASKNMLSVLLNQRLNGKIPFYLHSQGIRVAHKTGEDAGISHDCGIVFAEKPFIACFLSANTNVPAFERGIQDISRALAFPGVNP